MQMTTGSRIAQRSGELVDVGLSALGVPASGRRARSRPDMALVDIGDAVLRCRMRGEGPKLVMFIDPPMALEQYDELLDELAPRFRVIAFGVPGFGFSRVRRGFDFSRRGYAEAYVRLIERVRARPCTFVAPCVFAYAALEAASMRPDLIDRVVLMQVPSWQEKLRWKGDRDPDGVLHKPLLGQVSLFRKRRARAHGWLDFVVGERARVDELRRCADEAFADGARFSLATTFQGFLTDRFPPPDRVEQPTLAIWGEADRSHAATHKESSRALGADVRLCPMAGLGHLPELEAPARVAREIERFVGVS